MPFGIINYTAELMFFFKQHQKEYLINFLTSKNKFKMKKTNSFLCLLILLISIESCKKKNTELTKRENILNENATIVEPSQIITSSNTAITILKDSTSLKYKVGDILIASPSENDTLGLLVKIKSITTNSNTIEFETEPSNLNEAFKQLYIDESITPDYQHEGQYKKSRGVGGSISLIYNHNNTIGVGLEINGNLELNFPKTRIKYCKQEGHLLPDTVLIAQDFNTHGSNIEVKAVSAQSPEFSLKEFELPDIYVPVSVGPLLVMLPFTQKVDIKLLPATFSGTAKAKFLPEITATLGASYINGNWENISTYNIIAGYTPSTKSEYDLQVHGELTIINPTYEISPFGSENFKAFFSVPNKLTLDIKPSNPNYSVKYSVNVQAGLQAKFWLGVETSISVSSPSLEKTIAEGNFKYNIGDTAFGGLIFYLDSTGEHGMVCSMDDLAKNLGFLTVTVNGNVISGNLTFVGGIISQFNSGIGGGLINTNYWISSFSPTTEYHSIIACQNYGAGGFSDWVLPSSGELNQLYQNKWIANNLTDSYWCSNFVAGSDIAIMNMNNGVQGTSKVNTNTFFNVRAVRSF